MKQPKSRRLRQDAIPLCVDLDGTLIKTDLLIEALLTLLKRDVLSFARTPFWLLKGKAYFKHQIAERAELDVTQVPCHAEFLDYLRDQHSRGRPLVLATASPVKFARKIAAHLGLFTDVFASEAQMNLSGRAKLDRLRTTFGERGFDYAGNARTDLKIWPHARRAILVNTTPSVRRAVEREGIVERIFDDRRSPLKRYVEALRPHQWLKNLLVFVHLFAAHEWQDLALIAQTAVAFVAFCLCASSVYLLNDLLDLEADRNHVRKRLRAIAAGAVPIGHAVVLVPLLLAAAFGVALLLPLEFLLVLATYYIANIAYSLRLKRVSILDVLVLAGLYTIRIMAGAAVVPEMPSFWLMAFAMFIFFSLAMIKRYAELLSLRDTQRTAIEGRRYQLVDLDTLIALGTSSGYLAVLVLALYINSPEIAKAYTHPKAIWLMCPLLMYWLARLWLVTGRGQMHDDPLVYALRDWRSRLAGVIGIAIFLVAL